LQSKYLIYLRAQKFYTTMLIIPIKEGDTIEKALKKYKKKFEKVGVLKQIRDKMFYKKPSERKKEIINRAIIREKIRRSELEI
jgi:small subunit ribosomal protein S21